MRNARMFSELHRLSLCDRRLDPVQPKPKRERRLSPERRSNPRSGRRSIDNPEGREGRAKVIVDYLSKRKRKKRV